jgi:signal transduction histidine kinase
MIDSIRRVFNAGKDLSTRFPAFLSGLIMYSYLSFNIVRFLLKAHAAIPTFYDVLETFDAVPFMWLLSVAMVKIIEVQGKLHESETQRILAQQQIDLKETQLNTLHEVVKSMQHHINNPLAIIALAIGPARRHAQANPELTKQLDLIEDSTQRIVRTLKTFFQSDSYQTEQVDAVVGSIASLPHVQSESPGKTGPRQ